MLRDNDNLQIFKVENSFHIANMLTICHNSVFKYSFVLGKVCIEKMIHTPGLSFSLLIWPAIINKTKRQKKQQVK